MHLDFPSSPTNGQKYPASPVAGIPTYVWDSEKWTTVAGSVSGKTAIVSDGSVPMVAQLTLVTPPVAATDAASKGYVDAKPVPDVTKSYVDAGDAALNTAIGNKVAKAGDTMTGALNISAATYAANIKFISTTDGYNKIVRIGASGSLEVVNNANSAVIMSLTDAGALTVTNSITAGTNLTVGGTIIGGGCPITWPIATRVGANLNMGFFADGTSGAIGCINDSGSKTGSLSKIDASSVSTMCPLTVAGDIAASPGNLIASANVWANSGTVYLKNDGSAYLNYSGAGGNITLNVPGTNTNILLVSNGRVQLGNGLSNKAGFNGGYTGYNFNVNWNGSNNYNCYLDGTYVGDLAYVSDYRIKKNVIDLPGMWDTVRALRPIKYQTQQFSTPSHKEHIAKQVAHAKKMANEAREKGEEVDAQSQMIPGPLTWDDDTERWGFIAHELQDTLTPTAATAVKDAPDALQSPNPWTVIAALTRALQEAMTRIETLETRLDAA